MRKSLMIYLFAFFLLSQSIAQSKISPHKSHYISKLETRTNPDTIILKKDTTPISIVPEEKVFFIQNHNNGSSLFKDILPLITLLLGIVINKLLDFLRDRKKVTKSGERWVAEIRAMDSSIDQQIELLEENLKKDTEDVYDYPELVVISTLNCEIFKSLDKSELLKYIERKRRQNYDRAIIISNQTHGLISILTHLHESLEEKFDEYLKGISMHIVAVNKNLQFLLQAFAWYGVNLEQELKGDPKNDPRYNPILNLFDKYITPHMHDGAYNLFELQEHFFWPLVQFLGKHRHDDRTREMANYASVCLNEIKGIRMEKRYWHENMKTIAERYKEHRWGLKEVADKIEQRDA